MVGARLEAAVADAAIIIVIHLSCMMLMLRVVGRQQQVSEPSIG